VRAVERPPVAARAALPLVAVVAQRVARMRRDSIPVEPLRRIFSLLSPVSPTEFQ
jgi:hypothetical protein